jgi:hypothetical protein
MGNGHGHPSIVHPSIPLPVSFAVCSLHPSAVCWFWLKRKSELNGKIGEGTNFMWGLLLGIIIHIGERVKNQLIGMNRADPPSGKRMDDRGRRRRNDHHFYCPFPHIFDAVFISITGDG